jgi:endonuclease YncB( thermonuclease family)
MDYTLLYGQFVIRYPDIPNQGPEPDGDTIKFLPDHPQLVMDLPRISGRPPKINKHGISVRLEAIDALETHFNNTHQQLQGANMARDELLAHLGLEDVVFFENHSNRIKSANHDSLPGYVLSNGIDANGRLIGFVYKGSDDRPGDDGSTIMVDTILMDKSINTKLLAAGHVYPAFYGTLPAMLREHLSSKSQAARAAKKGIWPWSTADLNGAAEVSSLKSLETLVMWPKLFRRLVVFLSANNEGLHGFDTWLRKDHVNRDDRIFRLDTNTHVYFHDIITIDGDSIMLNVQFEEVVIEPDPVS